MANTVLVARLAEAGTFSLRKLFYRRTLRMDLASFHNDGTSDLMSRFTFDMETVSAGMTALFGKVIREPIKAIACLVGAAFICWRLLLLSLVIAPLAALVIHWLAKSLKRANRRAMEEMAQLYSTLEETFRGIKVVKAFTMERHERRRFHHNSKHYFRKAMKIARYDSLTQADDRGDGHRDDLPGPAGRRLPGAQRRDAPAGHPHERPAAEPGVAAGVLRAAGRDGRSDAEAVGRVHAAAARGGGQRPDLRDARPRAAGPRPREAPAAGPAPPRSGVRQRRLRLPHGRPRPCGGST